MWQPIETAPTDGTVIDVWVAYAEGGGKRVPDAYWLSGDTPPFFDDKRTSGWAGANMGYDGCDGWADEPEDGSSVTHWMPVPDSPQ